MDNYLAFLLILIIGFGIYYYFEIMGKSKYKKVKKISKNKKKTKKSKTINESDNIEDTISKNNYLGDEYSNNEHEKESENLASFGDDLQSKMSSIGDISFESSISDITKSSNSSNNMSKMSGFSIDNSVADIDCNSELSFMK